MQNDNQSSISSRCQYGSLKKDKSFVLEHKDTTAVCEVMINNITNGHQHFIYS